MVSLERIESSSLPYLLIHSDSWVRKLVLVQSDIKPIDMGNYDATEKKAFVNNMQSHNFYVEACQGVDLELSWKNSKH